jgi:hypothetical protein
VPEPWPELCGIRPARRRDRVCPIRDPGSGDTADLRLTDVILCTRRRKVRLLESLDAWRLSAGRRHSIYYRYYLINYANE